MAFKFCRNGSRNYPEGMLLEFNGTESMTPKSSVGKCRRSIWASSTNNKQCPFFLHHHHRPRHPPTSPPLHRHQWPPSRTTTTARTTWQRHVTKRISASHSDRDGRCHVAVGDVATNRRTTTMSSFVVSVDLITVSTPLLRPKATR